MSRFSERLNRADRRVFITFAESVPVSLFVGEERRDFHAIFEEPDNPVVVKGGGEIADMAPAIIADPVNLSGVERCQRVLVNGSDYWISHIGANELGMQRLTLAVGEPGAESPQLPGWSKKR